MNFRHLQVFITAAETHSMSKASKALYISQPAVTQAITELEAELQVKLFERTSRRLILTYSGEILYNHAKKALSLIDEAKSQLHDIANRRMGRLNIGASSTFGIYLLPQIIKEFKTNEPHIQTYITIGNSRVIEEMILDNRIDLGLVTGLSHSQDVTRHHLLDDEIILVASPFHHWVQEGRISVELDEVHKEQLVLRETGSGTREIVEHEFREHGISLNECHTVNNLEAIKKAVEADIGIAFLSKMAVLEELAANRLVEITIPKIKLIRKINLIYHKAKYNSPVFYEFVKFLKVQFFKDSI